MYETCLLVPKTAALRIESFPCDHSVNNATLTEKKSRRERNSVNVKSISHQLIIKIISEYQENDKNF